MVNNNQAAFVCNEIVSLGAIFNGAVFSMQTIASSVFCEVLHSEEETREHSSRCAVFYKTFHRLRWEKKVKQKPVPYMDQDVAFFRRLFTAFNRKKGDAGAAS